MKISKLFNNKSATQDWPERMILYAVLTVTKSLLEIESKEDSLYGHTAEDSLETINQAIKYYHDPNNNSYPEKIELEFLPTGPLQELSMTNGWDQVYLKLAESFDQTYKTLKP